MTQPTNAAELAREIQDAEAVLEGARAMLTLAEVYRFFHVDRRTVYRWVNAGLLPAYKLPYAGYRFDPQDVLAFRAKHIERCA